MSTIIEPTEDVKAIAKLLIAERVSLHPVDDFNDYVNFKEDILTYKKGEAHVRNVLMNKCFDFCEKDGVDIYEVMLEVSLSITEMDKFIPLPSQPYPENN